MVSCPFQPLRPDAPPPQTARSPQRTPVSVCFSGFCYCCWNWELIPTVIAVMLLLLTVEWEVYVECRRRRVVVMVSHRSQVAVSHRCCRDRRHRADGPPPRVAGQPYSAGTGRWRWARMRAGVADAQFVPGVEVEIAEGLLSSHIPYSSLLELHWPSSFHGTMVVFGEEVKHGVVVCTW